MVLVGLSTRAAPSDSTLRRLADSLVHGWTDRQVGDLFEYVGEVAVGAMASIQ